MSLLERLAKRIEANWYASALGNLWLLPFWLLFVVISSGRRAWYRLFPAPMNKTPVLVVGNISVGGTGKTPLISYLVERAQALGIPVAIISRGYGGQADSYPLRVTSDTPASESGDEPKLLSRLGCPIIVDPVRSRAALAVADEVDLILSDDGMQHYALDRQAEVLVTDATRQLGNGWCLPIGPLREPKSRMQQADVCLANGEDFKIEPVAFVSASDGRHLPLNAFSGQRVHAVAGIGNPARFFTSLSSLGCEPLEHPFPDHHDFKPQDLSFKDDLAVVMTEKDWVKCTEIPSEGLYYLLVKAVPTEATAKKLDELLITTRIQHG